MDEENRKFREIGQSVQLFGAPNVFYRAVQHENRLAMEKLRNDLGGVINQFGNALLGVFGSDEFHAAMLAAQEAAAEMEKLIEDQQPKGKPARQPVLPDPRRSRGKGGKMRWRRE